MRRVLIIAPYFTPSNLAGVQRVRVMSRALKNYGWTPIVVTVNAESYEEQSDFTSFRLLPDDLAIERVSALPKWLCRAIGIGDISLRAQWALRRRVAKLIQTRRPSIIFATVLPGYTSLVGAWAKQRFRIPLVLDYQDPWVAKSSSSDNHWNKAGLARRMARWLEPRAIRSVDALTAVSDETLETLRLRNLIKPNIPVEIIPIGADRQDHAVAKRYGHSLIGREDGKFHIAYLGTLTNRMLPALEAFLAATRSVLEKHSQKIFIHLIGTSARPMAEDQHNLGAMAEKHGLVGHVNLHPARIGYLDALRTMQDADLLLLLGSTDLHYTASKLFPYWLTGKPILGLFHQASTIVPLSRELGGVKLLLFDNDNLPESRVGDLELALSQIINGEVIMPPRCENAFGPYSAEGVSARFASLFDRAAKICA